MSARSAAGGSVPERARRLLARLVPPPRRPLGPWSVAPLLIFLAAYAAAIVTIEATHLALFSAPWQFLWLAVAPWAWWLHVAGWGGLRGVRGQLSLLTRLLMIGALAAVMAEPRGVRSSDALSIVYALDSSDSIGDKVSDQALAWILRTVDKKPQRDSAGLAVFGRDAAIELPPRQAFVFDAITSRLARDGTNLENALALSAAVLPDDAPGRIVLISDGTATEGDLERTLDQLASRKLPVDVLPVAYERDEEVWVEKIELPQEARPQQTYEAGVLLGSLRSGSGQLVLRENGREVLRRKVDYRAGKNRFALPLYLRGAGYYEYAATIEPEPGHDGWRENNTALGAITLQGNGHVLLAIDAGARDADWQPLAKALEQAGRQVEVRQALELPDDPLALLDCDAVALVDVPADAVSEAQQRALRDAVQELGVGLLMIGGQNGYGPGGWNRTPVEEALPVTMDINQRKVMPKGALAIIIEMSEFPDGDGWAKLIAKKAMKVLGARDEVGVITNDYQKGDHWIFPLSPAGDYDKLAPLVDGAELGDMPDFGSIMRVALEGLKHSDASAKHLLLLSDGDPQPPPPELLAEFVQNKIAVSTVLIVPPSSEDQALMRGIAEATHGRYYYPQDPAALPAIFIKEAKTLKRSQIQNKTFTPQARFPSPIMKGIAELPPLKGYTLTSPKPRAVTVLEGPDPEEEDPVLAVWRFGVGTAAAWTSDLSPNWGASWVEWSKYQAFVEQLFNHIARAQDRSQIRLSLDASGATGVLSVEDHAPSPGFLTVAARIATPDGKRVDLELPQVAPGRYGAHFTLGGIGRYQVAVSAVGGGAAGEERKERAFGSLVVPYSAEYLRFRANPLVLEHIAKRTGGRVLDGTEDGAQLFGAGRQPRLSSRPIFDWLLAALALLLPLDVALRRVQIDPGAVLAALLGRFRRGVPGESTATMGALLTRKQATSLPKADKPLAPLAPAPGPAGAAAATAPQPAKPAAPAAKTKAGAPPAGDGTTSKLLDAKRRRQQDQQQPPSKP